MRRTGVFMFGAVEMDEAGAGPPVPTDRRYSQDAMWHAAERMLDMGVRSEQLGYDVFWLTEHHFQYEGYEVIPNGVLFGVALAARTSRIQLGALVHIVTQWHPLRFAEDFATLHNLSGGRAVLGVGRGTVPREAEPLGTRIGSFDNPDAVSADAWNREQFEEAMEVVLAALDNETFSYHGRHFDLPPAGIPDRGGTVQELTLVPRPRHPYEVVQPITSPPTLEYVPRMGFTGVFWLANHLLLQRRWEQYQEVYERHHGALAPGDKRLLVLNVKIGDTHEEAMALARRGHDEFWKFLGPYGWSRQYVHPDGSPWEAGLIPTLEDSMSQRAFLVGTAEEVAEGIAHYQDLVGLDDLTIFPHLPGDTYDQADEQMQRFAEEVRPLLR